MSRVTKQDIQYENRKKTFMLGAIIFGILVVVAIIACIIELPKTSRLTILVAPVDATVKIGGKKMSNGTHRIEPGTYDVEISRNDFGSYTGQITLKENKTEKLYVCLEKNEGNDEYYDSHQKDYEACYTVQEHMAEKHDQEKNNRDPIFKIAPYHNYEKGFYIDPYFDEEEKVHIKISLVTCNKERAEGLKENALNWLAGKGVVISNYEIEYSSCAYGDD